MQGAMMSYPSRRYGVIDQLSWTKKQFFLCFVLSFSCVGRGKVCLSRLESVGGLFSGKKARESFI